MLAGKPDVSRAFGFRVSLHGLLKQSAVRFEGAIKEKTGGTLDLCRLEGVFEAKLDAHGLGPVVSPVVGAEVGPLIIVGPGKQKYRSTMYQGTPVFWDSLDLKLAVFGQLDAVPLVRVVRTVVVAITPLVVEDAPSTQLALELVS